jgi:branched-chain amino acid transport system permease protein
MTFLIGIVLLVGIYYLCGKASEIISSQLGLLSIAHATVIGTSAYTYAINTRSGRGAIAGALIAVGLAAICGAVLVLISQRVTGSEYSLLTFAWQLVWFAAVLNWRPVTGAALGLSGVAST